MARTSNRGNYPTHFPKKAVTEEEPDMTAEERERVAAGRGDAAAQWARENRIRAERMRQSVRSNAYLLVVFTALYLVPLVFANSWHARGLGQRVLGLCSWWRLRSISRLRANSGGCQELKAWPSA